MQLIGRGTPIIIYVGHDTLERGLRHFDYDFSRPPEFHRQMSKAQYKHREY